jgi:ATP:corrinoid adenosyltransferase
MEFKELNVMESSGSQIAEESFAGIMVDEINMERARYLLSTDEILESNLGQTQA